MSYQVVGRGQPVSKQRPGAVTAGVILLYVIALLVLFRGLLGVIEQLRYGDAIAAGIFPGGESFSELGTFSAVLAGILYTVVAAGTVATAVLVGKGRGPARVVAWCLTGVTGLCCACLSVGGLLQGTISGLPGGGSGVEQALSNLPSWFAISDSVSAIGIVLASLGVIVSLSVPVANDFFRKEEQVWVPPTWAGEPGYAFPPGAPTPYPQPPQVPQYPYAEPSAPAYPASPMYPAPPTYPAAPTPPAYPPAQPFPDAQPFPPAQPYPPASEPHAPPPNEPQDPAATEPRNPS